ncbi:Transposon Ty3-I Gag-Pol polyprotein [Labeo rohita]|uniref:ribonuclease H n=1 Tax=Labeo rohita TaxID=84645 RepID=A0ABQ8MWZ0_LABRO|nr:Transposon Ty3-I Gag-Pol polyprotein [Labeo rohita]
MPYGLSNSSSISQNFINEIFRDMLNLFVIIYIDNILIYSPSLKEHHSHVTRVLQCLREHHLYLKGEKWVQMDQRKVEAVRDWPQPTTVKEMQRFPLPLPRRPWSHLGVDFTTDLPPSQGFTTILVIVDRFSKACKLIPLKGLPTTLETAETLISSPIEDPSLYPGSGEVSSTCWECPEVYPQNTIRRRMARPNVKSRRLGETTDLTPFQCILGYQPPLFPWTGELTEAPAVDYWFRESERDIRLQLPSRKLCPHYIGPFPISRQINDVTYELILPNSYRIAPTFHVSLLKPYVNPLLPPSTDHEIPPPPEVDANKTIYRVKEILDSQGARSSLPSVTGIRRRPWGRGYSHRVTSNTHLNYHANLLHTCNHLPAHSNTHSSHSLVGCFQGCTRTSQLCLT